MNEEQLEMDLGEVNYMTEALTTALSTMKDVLGLFTETPTVYFVSMALLGAGITVARKLIPMRKG
jgi:hypothetical protein